MITHGLIVEGAGGTAAGTKTQIGSNITMPAGGPFTIHNIFGTVVKDTSAANEGTGGQLIIDSYSGDVTPDPAPGKFPLPGNAIASSANFGLGIVPLSNWDVQWEAAGKAVLQLSYLNILAITKGSDCVLGILFGEAVPAWKPIIFCEGIYASKASAVEQLLGTITLSEKATKITGILADLNKGDAATAGVPCAGYIRLASNDINFAPGMFPCNRGFDASAGTAVGAPSSPQSAVIPVDIDVPGGAIINIYGKTTASVTGNADFSVFIAYE